MLEMALVLPLLVLLLIVVVEFSRVLMVRQVIINAAREGARAGAVRLDDAGALSTANSVSEGYISSSGLDGTIAGIDASFVQTGGSNGLRVSINYSYESLLDNWIPGIPAMMTLRASAVMRREA